MLADRMGTPLPLLRRLQVRCLEIDSWLTVVCKGWKPLGCLANIYTTFIAEHSVIDVGCMYVAR